MATKKIPGFSPAPANPQMRAALMQRMGMEPTPAQTAQPDAMRKGAKRY